MRTILLLAAMTACGGDDPAHDVVTCTGAFDSSYIGTVSACERACAAGPQCPASDLDCNAALPACKVDSGPLGDCSPFGVATFEGERGCCANDGGTVRFTACEGE